MASLTDPETAALVAMSGVPGLGPVGIKRLVGKHGSATAALAWLRGRTPAAVSRAVGFPIRPGGGTAAALRDVRPATGSEALARAAELGVRVEGWDEPGYPGPLHHLVAPPPVLFLRGRPWPRFETCVAIVGTRRSTPYGRSVAHRLARDFARWGWTVVSGMARGIDAAAHAGALDGGGDTIGVLGSGHAHEYPRANRDLYRRMREGGLLVSELAPDVGPSRATFPLRNRIIAALSRAVVVVEAGERSGALSTAARATRLGREVLAVPGRVDAPASRGAIGLLRSGAGVAADVRDVFDAVGWVHDGPAPGDAPEPEAPGLSLAGRAEDARVLRALCGRALTADAAADEAGLDIGATLAALGRLEVDGRVARGSGGRFERVRRGTPA